MVLAAARVSRVCSVEGEVETDVEEEAEEDEGTGVWRGVSDCGGCRTGKSLRVSELEPGTCSGGGLSWVWWLWWW